MTMGTTALVSYAHTFHDGMPYANASKHTNRFVLNV